MVVVPLHRRKVRDTCAITQHDSKKQLKGQQQQQQQRRDGRQPYISEAPSPAMLFGGNRCSSSSSSSSGNSSPMPVRPSLELESEAQDDLSSAKGGSRLGKDATSITHDVDSSVEPVSYLFGSDCSAGVDAMATGATTTTTTTPRFGTTARKNGAKTAFSPNTRASASANAGAEEARCASLDVWTLTPKTTAAAVVVTQRSEEGASNAAPLEQGRVNVVVRIRPQTSKEPTSPCCRILEGCGVVEHIATPRENDAFAGRGVSAASMTFRGPLARRRQVEEKGNKTVFRFDTLLGEDASQADTMACVGNETLKHALAGYNATVMCYGQSGSGKTHTMIGPTRGDSSARLHTSVDDGLLPRMLESIMDAIQKRFPSGMMENESAPLHRRQDWRWRIEVSALELYQEELRDLLAKWCTKSFSCSETISGSVFNQEESFMTLRSNCQDTVSRLDTHVDARHMDETLHTTRASICSTGRSHRSQVSAAQFTSESGNLKIREDAEWGVVVEGLLWHPVRCKTDMMYALRQAIRQRRIGSTALNDRSSRSHFFFFVAAQWWDGAEDDLLQAEERSTWKPPEEGWTRSLLTFVDLAGSERVAATGASGLRLKEAQHINLSLTLLGNVIRKLTQTDEKRRTSIHIPYRDSKLTRLLRDSIGGNAVTTLLCTVSPDRRDAAETLSTLHFAQRAKRMRNHPVVNHTLSKAELESQLRAAQIRIACLEKRLALDSGKCDDPLSAPAAGLCHGVREEDLDVIVAHLSGQQLLTPKRILHEKVTKHVGTQYLPCEERQRLMEMAVVPWKPFSSFSLSSSSPPSAGAASAAAAQQKLQPRSVDPNVGDVVKFINQFAADNQTATSVCSWSGRSGGGRYRRHVVPPPPPYPPYLYTVLVRLLQAVVPSLKRQHPPVRLIIVPVGKLQCVTPVSVSPHSSAHGDQPADVDVENVSESSLLASAAHPSAMEEAPRTAAENRSVAKMLMRDGVNEILQA